MICDFLRRPRPCSTLLQRAERDLGLTVPEVDAHLAGLARPA